MHNRLPGGALERRLPADNTLSPQLYTYPQAIDEASSPPAGASIASSGDTLQVTVPGGSVQSGLLDSAWAVWRARAADGSPLSLGSGWWTMKLWLNGSNWQSLGLTTDKGIRVGILNGSDPSTANGVGCFVKFTGSTINAGHWGIDGGTFTESSGVTDADTAKLMMDWYGGSGGGLPRQVSVVSYDAADNGLVVDIDFRGVVGMGDLAGDQHIFVGGLAESTEATDVTIEAVVNSLSTPEVAF